MKQYYRYQKYLRSKLSRHLNEKAIKFLFAYADPVCELFSYEEQKLFLHINCIMINYFINSETHLIPILSGKRIGRSKLIVYLTAFRKVKIILEEEIQNLREKERVKNQTN